MPEKITKIKVIVKNTRVRRLKIKGLMPKTTVVINNLLLKDVTFYTVEHESRPKIKMRLFSSGSE
jgi:hypothetical protein